MPYCNGQGLAEVLWRTLIADTASRAYPAPPELGSHFSHYLLSRLVKTTNEEEMKNAPPKRIQMIREAVELLVFIKDLDPAGVLPRPNELYVLLQLLLGDNKERRQEIFQSASVFEHEAHPINLFRRLFLTSRGLLGLGPQSLQKSDSIWLLPGSRVPLILRSLGNGHHMVVGETYIHGIMHGEALDSKKVVFEDIVLE
jgi:hypothetical protein